jgi:enoyl-CoA hydratase/carnithine racemase
MQFKNVIYDATNGVGTITLNTPDNLNALSGPMYDDILGALALCSQDSSVKAMVINANGRAFCGGGDIGEMVESLKTSDDVGFDVLAPKAARVSQVIKQMPKPVIASVHGAVAGAAFNICLACDLIIAAEGAKFLQAFVNIGLIPDAGGVFLLTRAIGVSKAVELTMLGRPVTVDEAVDLGIVYKKCSKEELRSETEALANKLANGPGLAYAKLKELIYESQYKDFEKYMPLEVSAQVELGTTSDFKEGIRAFVEKRKPVFTGN